MRGEPNGRTLGSATNVTCRIAHGRGGLVHHKTMRALHIAIAGLLPFSAVAQPAADDPPAADPPAADAPAAPQTMGTLIIEAEDGTEVRVDDAVIGKTPLPGPWTLSPGTHTVELRPASGAPTVKQITVEGGQRVEIALGGEKPAEKPVEPEKVPAEALATPPPPAGPGFSLAMGGYIAAGLGLAVVGTGAVLGLQADGLAAEARDLDRASNDRADQQDLVDQADGAAFWANVSYGAGGVLLLSGAAMILLASDGPLSVAPAPGGAVVEGRF